MNDDMQVEGRFLIFGNYRDDIRAMGMTYLRHSVYVLMSINIVYIDGCRGVDSEGG